MVPQQLYFLHESVVFMAKKGVFNFIQRKDGRYQTQWKDANGKWHTITDKDPEKLYQRFKEAGSPKPDTFKEAAELWEREFRESCNIRTWNNYKPHFEDIVAKHGDKPLSEIAGVDIVQDLQRAKAQGYSRTIVNTRRTIYNNILNYAVAKGMIPWNAAGGIKLPKGLPAGKRLAPTNEQMRIIIESRDKPFGMFAFLLLCTGLRKGEALALTKADIVDGNITVSKSLTLMDGNNPKIKDPKSEAGNRTVPIISILEQPLADYIDSLKSPYLFPAQEYNGHSGGGYMSQSNYDTAWANYCKAAGLDGLTAHQLRHGTATLLFESGVDVYTAKKILGHAKITTTMAIYTELREQKEKKSISKFSDFMLDFVQNQNSN